MVADEIFFPQRFLYNFPTHIRHFQRYFQAVTLLKHLGKQEQWLDCACGSGYGTRFLADFVTDITGYDHNPDVIQYAQTHYQTANCRFTESLETLPTESFHAIFCIETIEHMERPLANQFLTDLFQLLRPEGMLIISTPIVPLSNSKPTNPYHLYEYSIEDFSVLLQDANLQIVEKHLTPQQFTDGETKNQGIFKCKKRQFLSRKLEKST